MKPAKRARLLSCLPIDGLRAKLVGGGREITGLQLYVLGEMDSPDEHTMEWFDQWWDRAKTAVPADFDFLGTVYGSLKDLSSLEYRQLVQLDFL